MKICVQYSCTSPRLHKLIERKYRKYVYNYVGVGVEELGGLVMYGSVWSDWVWRGGIRMGCVM